MCISDFNLHKPLHIWVLAFLCKSHPQCHTKHNRNLAEIQSTGHSCHAPEWMSEAEKSLSGGIFFEILTQNPVNQHLSMTVNQCHMSEWNLPQFQTPIISCMPDWSLLAVFNCFWLSVHILESTAWNKLSHRGRWLWEREIQIMFKSRFFDLITLFKYQNSCVKFISESDVWLPPPFTIYVKLSFGMHEYIFTPNIWLARPFYSPFGAFVWSKTR